MKSQFILFFFILINILHLIGCLENKFLKNDLKNSKIIRKQNSDRNYHKKPFICEFYDDCDNEFPLINSNFDFNYN